MTASSDEVAAVGAAFVQLKMLVQKERAAQPEHVAMGAWVPRLLGDAKSSLGDAKSSLGDAKSSMGDA